MIIAGPGGILARIERLGDKAPAWTSITSQTGVYGLSTSGGVSACNALTIPKAQ